MKEKAVTFEIPEVGFFKIDVNDFKYLPPFTHSSKNEKKKDKQEKDKMNKYTVWHDGCGIGSSVGIDKIEDGYTIIREYAKNQLTQRKNKCEYELEKINKALEVTEKFDWIQLFRKE
jgi:hypothetical protein